VIRKCTRCKRNLPISDFYNYKHGMNGLETRCKECYQYYMKKNKENKKRREIIQKYNPLISDWMVI